MPEFSGPFSGVVPRKLTKTELARAIMLDISAELEAIHLYQAHIDATDDERAKAVLAHVRNEEEEHVGEFLALLEHLAPDLAERVREGHAEMVDMIGRVESGVPAEEAAAAGEGEAAPAPPSLGSLRP
jgi:rubrerythrin